MSKPRLGVAYYPECFPPEQWAEDVERMAEAGIDTVRLAEFAWSRMETDEGVFEFDWLEEFVELAGASGIRTVLGTPTESPPPWLIAKYPKVLPVDERGLPRGAGGRRHYCVNNPTYLRRCDGVVEAMAARFGDNPNVIGWQLDNEAGCHDSVRCYCTHCRMRFQQWLKARYGSVEALNRAWYAGFWSHDVTDFRQVMLHANSRTGVSPQQRLDFLRFGGASWIAFLDRQVDVLRPRVGEQFITHNITWYQEQIDMYALTERLDFVGIDSYQRRPYKMAMVNAWFGAIQRGRKHWIMEMPSGITDRGARGARRPLRADKLRSLFLRHYLRGAGACSMWHFRRHLGGQEMFLGACVDHDGRPSRAFEGVREVGRILREHGEVIGENRPREDVALLHAYDDLFLAAMHWKPLGFSGPVVLDDLLGLLKALETRGLGVTFARPEGDELAELRWPAVFAPMTLMMTEARADALAEYVRRGGVLVASGRLGQFDAFGKAQPTALPAMLTEVFGAELGETERAGEGEALEATGRGRWSGEAFRCGRGQALRPDGAETLAEFRSGLLAGEPAVTCNAVGDGQAVYVGLERCEQDVLGALTERLLAEAPVEPLPPVPDGLERIRGDRLTGYINYSEDDTIDFDLDAPAEDLLSGETKRHWSLPPYAAAIFSEK